MLCAFCNSDEPLTREHLWPEWIAGVMKISDSVSISHKFGIAGEENHLREFRRKPFREKVRAVCADCNNGWMSRLETEMKRYTLPILEGRGRHLHERAQAVVSMWAAVKLLVGEYTMPPELRIIPAEHYPMVFDARDSFELPRDSFEAHTSAYQGPRIGFYERTAMKVSGTDHRTNTRAAFDAWIGTFVIDRLAIRVLGHTVPEPVHIGFRGEYAQRVHQLWPPTKPFDWPPGPPLNDAGLDWFSNGPIPMPQPLTRALGRLPVL
jgi:hypothetical protein